MNASNVEIREDHAAVAAGRNAPSRAWRRALELTTPIATNPGRILPVVMQEAASKFNAAPALLSSAECFSYRTLGEQANRYARWALDVGLAKGETVCLMMPNRPEYMAIWLGITGVGGVVALMNTNLRDQSLAHAMNIVAPNHVIVAAEFVDSALAALSCLPTAPKVWVHGSAPDGVSRIDCVIPQYAGEELDVKERRGVTIQDRALYLYTSGTTGMPKAANVSHARLMQWSHWFSGMIGTTSSDRLYNCLPMFHSTGGVLATGAVLISGGSVVLRRSFSASQFWIDVVNWDCTLFQYIGELCRYLLHTKFHPLENQHRIRMCCGNGLRPDVWNHFKNRFRIPQILEFYAATEGNVSLFNIEGKPGAIGRVPPYLANRFPATLVQFDVETGEPVRNEQGFCVPCQPNEAGEALGQLLQNASNIGSRFEGYTSQEASEKKLLRDVFAPGDAWYRTGDLMRRDEQGYFYFVDRIGDTFRWKGENVATSEVSEAICSFPGVDQAVVYGVAVPGAEGRAGMAMLIAGDTLDLAALRSHLINRLPDYAVPLFVRIRSEMQATATFKPVKLVFQREGYDPAATTDVIYFHHKERQSFVRLDRELYDRIQLGNVRL